VAECLSEGLGSEIVGELPTNPALQEAVNCIEVPIE
jgi:hypothetical protein